VLHVVRPSHLGNEPARGRKFFIGNPDLGFAIVGAKRKRQHRGGRHHHLFDNATRGNPGFRVLEGPREDAHVIGKRPWRINTLPTQCISLKNGSYLITPQGH